MIKRTTSYWPLVMEIYFFQTISSCLWFSLVADFGKMSVLRDFPGYVVVFSLIFFFVVLSIGDKGDLDLGLGCVLDIGVLFWFFMFDVGEDLRHCDISLCEGTGIGKGFGYDDEVCC